ncbi:hypothetical protein TCAL_04720 [Tigriopus californicus]|uniref:Hexosyltransferase n=1 Tax=Tigriopus californicus TaxID=6832 RepID=A0A553PTD5_TIGCA|nr:hypothetical protein TCAL_04720 [Tigriopus californicus]
MCLKILMFTLEGSSTNAVAPLDLVLAPNLNYSYPIDLNETVCLKPDILLLAVVISAPQNFLKRRLIRQTWGGAMQDSQSMNVIFFIGQSTDQSINGLDTYLNLSQKGIFFMEWILQKRNCSQIKWILKVDDDVILNPYELHSYIIANHRYDYKIHCKIHRKSRVQRDPSQKWCRSSNQYPDEFYPPYCSGPMYLLSAKTIPQLVSQQRKDPDEMFSFEDIYYTGILAQRANLNLKEYSSKLKFSFTFDVNAQTLFVIADGLNDTFATYAFPAVWENLINSRADLI